jgi:lipopolysaccharide transport system permease protein
LTKLSDFNDIAYSGANLISNNSHQMENTIHIKPTSGWDLPSFKEVWSLRGLIFRMLISNFKSKYRQSVLSFLYLFIQPLFSVGVFTFIFSGLANIKTGAVPYPLFTFIGVISWGFFSRSLNDGNSSLVSMSAILSKIYMPRLVVLVVSAINQLVEYLIALSLLAVFFIYFKIVPSYRIVYLPLVVFCILFLSMSIVLWISNLNVRFRDVSMLLPGVMQVLFYATPVVYPLDLVSEKWRWLFMLNPMTNLIELLRFCLFDNYPAPSLFYLAINFFFVIVLFFFGLIIFNRFSKSLVDKL